MDSKPDGKESRSPQVSGGLATPIRRNAIRKLAHTSFLPLDSEIALGIE